MEITSPFYLSIAMPQGENNGKCFFFFAQSAKFDIAMCFTLILSKRGTPLSFEVTGGCVIFVKTLNYLVHGPVVLIQFVGDFRLVGLERFPLFSVFRFFLVFEVLLLKRLFATFLRLLIFDFFIEHHVIPLFEPFQQKFVGALK